MSETTTTVPDLGPGRISDDIDSLMGNMLTARARALVVQRQPDVTLALGEADEKQSLVDCQGHVEEHAKDYLEKKIPEAINILEGVKLIVDQLPSPGESTNKFLARMDLTKRKLEDNKSFSRGFFNGLVSFQERAKYDVDFLEKHLDGRINRLSGNDGEINNKRERIKKINKDIEDDLEEFSRCTKNIGKDAGKIINSIAGSIEKARAKKEGEASGDSDDISDSVIDIPESSKKSKKAMSDFKDHIKELQSAHTDLAKSDMSLAVSVEISDEVLVYFRSLHRVMESAGSLTATWDRVSHNFSSLEHEKNVSPESLVSAWPSFREKWSSLASEIKHLEEQIT